MIPWHRIWQTMMPCGAILNHFGTGESTARQIYRGSTIQKEKGLVERKIGVSFRGRIESLEPLDLPFFQLLA